MPRCTIHCARSDRGADAFEDFWRDFRATVEATRPPFSRSNTMCFPTRCTAPIRLDSRVATISDAADFNGSGLDPSHTDSMTSPVTRLARPRAMVSTSGSSGMRLVYRRRATGIRLQENLVRDACSLMPNCHLLPTGVIITSTPLLRLSFVIQRPVDSVRATSVCDPALRLRAAALFIFQGVAI